MNNWINGLMYFLRANEVVPKRSDDVDSLIIDLQDGKGSFTSILGHYTQLLISKSKNNWVVGYTPSELYQELAMKLFDCCLKWDRNRDVGFDTYLYSSLDHHIGRLVRKASSQKRLSEIGTISYDFILATVDEEGLVSDKPIMDIPSYEEAGFSRAELLSNPSLSEKEKICVEMIFEGRMGYEIAERLNVSRASVSQIRDNLRLKLGLILN